MKEISRFLATVELLRRDVAKAIPTQQVVLFLTVVEQPGITMPELCRRLKMPQGSVSRNVKALSSYTERVHGVPALKGHGLLRTEPDPVNRQCLAVHPTARGRAIVERMASLLNPEGAGLTTVPRTRGAEAELYDRRIPVRG